MKSIVTIIFCVIATMAYAQEQDTTSLPVEPVPVQEDTIPKANTGDSPKIIYYQTIPEEEDDNVRGRRKDIRTLSGSMSHSGGFGALSFRSSSFRGETLVMAGMRGGWIINRTLAIGLEAHGIIPTAKYDDIDPMGEVVALGGYGGIFLEPIFFSNQVVHVTFPVSAGAGWIGYSYDFNEKNPPRPGSNIVDEDVFWYVEPGAGLEVNLSRSFRLAFGASKRFTQDFELADTKSGAFNKLNYFVTLKVGGF